MVFVSIPLEREKKKVRIRQSVVFSPAINSNDLSWAYAELNRMF